jgi:hypothetical protein
MEKGAEEEGILGKLEKDDPKQEQPISKEEKKLEKQVFKKRKWPIFLIIIFISLLIAIVAFIIVSKITVTISDELNLGITPEQQSAFLKNGETAKIVFQIKNNNLLQCNAECNFTLTNEESNASIYTAVEILQHGQTEEKSFDAKAPAKGSGQTLYILKAACHNLKSFICITDEQPKESISVAAINYDLNDEDKTTREQLRPKIQRLLLLSNTSSELIGAIPLERIPQGTTEGDQLKSQLISEKQMIEDAASNALKLKSLWDAQDYPGLRDFFSQSQLDKLEGSPARMDNYTSLFQALANERNRNIAILERIRPQRQTLSDMRRFYSSEPSPANYLRESRLSNISEAIFDSYLLITVNVTHSELELNSGLEYQYALLAGEISEFTNLSAKLDLYSIFNRNLLMAKNITLQNYTAGCDGLRMSSQGIADANSMALLARANQTNETNITADEISNAEQYISFRAWQNTLDQIQNIPDRNLVFNYAKSLSFEWNGSPPTNAAISLAQINNTIGDRIIPESCRDPGFGKLPDSTSILNLIGLDYEKLHIINYTLSTFSTISPIVLDEHPDICCALGICTPCCSEACSTEKYPILFVPGHSLNANNPPDYSLSLFNNIQDRMEQEDFVNLGTLDLKTSDNFTGFWGRVNRSVDMKANYYYIRYYSLGSYTVGVQNNEGIENYAIRLKEMINLVKQKTGKQKVILVAHSMGGLVAREYLSLFGASDVDKLIMLNTPNHGISGKVKQLCSALGSKQECSDMSEDSIFLSRLNSQTLPAGIAYAIRSTGCSMDNRKTGDGIVTNESAYLEGAVNYEIPGNCTDALQSNLHNSALDPEKHPQVYNLILSLLKD